MSPLISNYQNNNPQCAQRTSYPTLIRFAEKYAQALSLLWKWRARPRNLAYILAIILEIFSILQLNFVNFTSYNLN